MAITVSDMLLVTQGATSPWEILLIDEQDNLESLAGADRASLRVKRSLSDATPILSKSTGGSGLTINSGASKLIATLSGAESDGLPTGLFLAEVAVRYGSDDAWYWSDPFQVRVLPAVAFKAGA